MTEYRTAAPEKVPDPLARAILDALVRSKGLERYAYFFVTGEGHFFPNGIEESSGSVIDDRGRVFDFWMGLDPETGRPGLTVWREVEPELHWQRSAEYQQAREAVGLR